MIAIFLAWLILFFVCYIWGYTLICLYNKLAKEKENYNLFETICLGLFAISVPLLLWSLLLPSNHIFLIAIIITSLISLFVLKDDFSSKWKATRNVLSKLSHTEKTIIALMGLVILASNMWLSGTWDSIYYHYQNIAWNEHYAVVPGLANIEDRLGFNSLYMLLSSVFTFSSIWNYSIYPLQSFVFIIFSAWVVRELFRSQWELSRLVLFAFYVLFFLTNAISLFDTSTDILPNILAFYLLARITLYPNYIERKKLLIISIPIFLALCKLTMAPLALISIYLVIRLYKKGDRRAIYFISSLSLLASLAWLARNILRNWLFSLPPLSDRYLQLRLETAYRDSTKANRIYQTNRTTIL